MAEFAIQMTHMRKSFGGVQALKDVCLQVRPGTIHALVGENGAGKSTLMKILAGIYQKDAGDLLINGTKVEFHSPKQSQRHGIAIIHQELALAPDLTVAENLFLSNLAQGSPLIAWKKLRQQAQVALDPFGLGIQAGDLVGNLSIAYQQVIEIAKALTKQAKILILDEPTAVLADPEIEVLFRNLKKLKQQGVTIVYISHRLEEIFRIADDITVIKDGETITTLDPATCTEDQIITNMVGRKMESLFPIKQAPPTASQQLLAVRNLNRPGVLKNIHFHIKKGEIVGLAGLVGSGRSELARCLFGIDPFQAGGEIHKDGKACRIHSPQQAIKHGIGLVPEDRKLQGGVLEFPIAANITMARLRQVSRWGVLRKAVEKQQALSFQNRLNIKLGSIANPLSSLSGGNQQKVVLAKWLNTACDVLILDEPTRGVDVGAKSEIFKIITDLAAQGYGILMISSELVEIVNLCHRTYVMCEGSISGELQGADITEENIMRLALPKRHKTN